MMSDCSRSVIIVAGILIIAAAFYVITRIALSIMVERFGK